MYIAFHREMRCAEDDIFGTPCRRYEEHSYEPMIHLRYYFIGIYIIFAETHDAKSPSIIYFIFFLRFPAHGSRMGAGLYAVKILSTI